MNPGKTIFIFLVLFLSSGVLYAETSHQKLHSLKLGVNVRFRYEYQNNFNIKSYGKDPVVGEENDGFIIGRFRTGLDYYFFCQNYICLYGYRIPGCGIWIYQMMIFTNTISTESITHIRIQWRSGTHTLN